MCLLPDLSSENTIQAIKYMFGRFGIPIECVTDSGPLFGSTEFKDFASNYELIQTHHNLSHLVSVKWPSRRYSTNNKKTFCKSAKPWEMIRLSQYSITATHQWKLLGSLHLNFS